MPEPDKHEQETLTAIKENMNGLKQISGERIWVELHKILEGNHGGELLKTMLDLGVAEHVGLSVDADVCNMIRIWNNCKIKNWKLRAVTLLTSLCQNQSEFQTLHERLKFSTFDRDLGFFIITRRNEPRLDVNPLR